MKNTIWILLFSFFAFPTIAQIQDWDNTAFFAYTKELKELGNHYYHFGNRKGIQTVIKNYQTAIEERRSAGLLTKYNLDSLNNEVYRLEGDYYYELADIDTSAFRRSENCFLHCLQYAKTHTRNQTAYRDQFILYQELAQLYYKQRRYQEAFEHMNKAFSLAANYYSPDDDELFDLTGQLAICLARIGSFDSALSYIEDVIKNYIDTNSERYGEALRRKGKILMLQQETLGCHAKEAADCYRHYFSLKRKDALNHFLTMGSEERTEYWASIQPFVTDCYRLEDADPALLYDVALFSKALLLQLDSHGGGVTPLSATWKDIQKALPKNGCAIEFLQYEKYDRQQMAAVIVSKTGKPQFVHLLQPDSIYNYQIDGHSVSERLYCVNGDMKESLYTDTLGLFKLLWNKELLSAIGQAEEIFFAPDGYLHQLAIEYMLPDDRIQINAHRLTTTRQLLHAHKKNRTNKVLLVGDVDYQHLSCDENNNNDWQAYDYLKCQKVYFRQLANSRIEVDSIAAIWGDKICEHLIGDSATEANFRQSSVSSNILHISSHGLFGAATVPQGTDLRPCKTDETLSESILALVGIQRAIENNHFDNSFYDGILSAKEISSLDLQSVSLVVLACCETGLGYITAEGVYGIQRGFKNAGVQAMVVSLWDVSDTTTHIFMIVLHRLLNQGMSISKAFRTARLDLIAKAKDAEMYLNSTCKLSFNDIEKYNALSKFQSSQYLNSFILIDAIE